MSRTVNPRPRTVDTDTVRLRILELGVNWLEDQSLAVSAGPSRIAGQVDLPESEIRGVLGFAGWPSIGSLTRARDGLRQRLAPKPPTRIGGPVPGARGPSDDTDPRAFVSTDEDLELPDDDEDEDVAGLVEDVELDDLVDAHARRATAPEPTSPEVAPPGVPTLSSAPAGPVSFRAAMVRIVTIRAHSSNMGRDLGDLRDLARSIEEHGIRVPLALEVAGNGYRVRDGHRRLAAAQLAKRKTVPALIHAEALDDKDWLLESIDYNTRRQGYTPEDVRRVARQLEQLGVDRRGIAQAFNVSATKLREILAGPKAPAPAKEKRPPAVVSRKKVLDVVMRYREDLRARAGSTDVGAEIATKFFDELEGLLS